MLGFMSLSFSVTSEFWPFRVKVGTETISSSLGRIPLLRTPVTRYGGSCKVANGIWSLVEGDAGGNQDCKVVADMIRYLETDIKANTIQANEQMLKNPVSITSVSRLRSPFRNVEQLQNNDELTR